MPKSRHRRKGRNRRTTPHVPPRIDRHPELQANLPWLRRMFEVDEAEAKGDAEAALRLVEDMPRGPDGRPWWRPERVRRLSQLVELGDAAPAWARARWVLAQAAQSTPGRPQHAAEVAIETRGGPRTLWGVDDRDAMCKVIDHDWVYRQLTLHEYGGLARFLRTEARPALVDLARDIRSWVDVPMGAFELLDEAPDRITWRDLGSGRRLETVNLGGAAMLARGECAIGRVVRSDGVEVFESAPLCVPPAVGERVAAAPEEWIDAVAEGCRLEPFGDDMAALVARMHHFDLLFDLPCGIRRQLVRPLDPGLQSDSIGTGGNGQEYDAALVLAALGGELDLEGEGECMCRGCDGGAARPVGPLVAAALLEPGTVKALRPMLVPADATALTGLCAVLAAPADEVCRRLVCDLGAAA